MDLPARRLGVDTRPTYMAPDILDLDHCSEIQTCVVGQGLVSAHRRNDGKGRQIDMSPSRLDVVPPECRRMSPDTRPTLKYITK